MGVTEDVCRACGGDGFVDRGLDRDRCTSCQLDIPRMRELLAAFRRAAGVLIAAEEELAGQIELVMRSWERVVKVLNPQAWQTPLQRAQELVDNLVLLGQIRVIVKE